MLARTALVASVLFTVASAQSASSLLQGLSSSCQSAALSLLSNQDLATCSAIGSLSSIVLTSGSIVQPINSWLETLCGKDDCSAATLQNASSVINSGCNSEISAGNTLVGTVQAVIANFHGVKEGLCLQYTSNSTLCLTDLLETMQNSTGQALTTSYLTSLDASKLASLGTTSYCTDCTHGLVTKLKAALTSGTSSSGSDSFVSAITSACGSSFADGTVPSTLSEATGANSTVKNGVQSNNFNSASSTVAGLWKVAGAALLGAAGVATLA